MRNFIAVILVFLSVCENILVSQGQQLVINNTDASNMINIPKTCRRRHYTLFPLIEDTVFLATYHNLIDSVIKLITYWKMENVVFIIDSQTGVGPTAVRAYLNIRLTKMAFDVIFMDSRQEIAENLMTTSESFSNFVIICSERTTDEIINVMKIKNLFHTSHRWIFVSQAFPEILQKTIISVDSQVTLISPQVVAKFSMDATKSPEMFIYDVFYSYQTKQTEYVKFAHWTVQKGLFILENLESRDGLQRLRGRQMKFGAFVHMPYVNITRWNGNTYFSGYKVEVMEMLMTYFNTKYSIKEYPQSWGVFANGTYTGLLGVVYRKEIDVPINGFMQAEFRAKASRFLFPLTKLDLSMGYTTPTPVVSPAAHVFPFSAEVWICIVIGLICVLVALAIAMRFSPGWKSAQIPSLTSHSDIFRLVTGTFFEEALHDPPGSTAKVIYGTLVIATLAVFVFYISVFTSFLTYRELKMPIRNLKDLAESREYSAVTVISSVYHGLFRSAQDGIFREIWKKIAKSETKNLVPGITAAIQSMYPAKNVLLADSASIIAGMNNNCSISVIKTRLLHENLCMITRNDFPYSRMIYMRLLHMTEGGLLERFGKKYMTASRPPCDEPTPSLTLGLIQVAGLFFLLSCGMLLALVILLIEKTSNSWKAKSIRKFCCRK